MSIPEIVEILKGCHRWLILREQNQHEFSWNHPFYNFNENLSGQYTNEESALGMGYTGSYYLNIGADKETRKFGHSISIFKYSLSKDESGVIILEMAPLRIALKEYSSDGFVAMLESPIQEKIILRKTSEEEMLSEV